MGIILDDIKKQQNIQKNNGIAFHFPILFIWFWHEKCFSAQMWLKCIQEKKAAQGP